MKAIYVSIWDTGEEIETSCDIDLSNNRVENVETSNQSPDGVCEEEYIEIEGGNQIRSFYNADTDTHYIDGRPI